MRRLLRFIALMTLRVVAVVTVIVWGTSQVQRLRTVVPLGPVAAEIQNFSDGYVAAVILKSNTRFQFESAGSTDVSLTDVRMALQSVRSGPAWASRSPQAFVIAAKYWLVLLVTVLLYGGIEYLGRRRGRL